MTKLKLGPLADDRPVKLAVELPAAVHRDLVAYAAALAAETGGETVPPDKLVAPMLAKFMASDRGFSRRRSAVKRRAYAQQSVAQKPLAAFLSTDLDDSFLGGSAFAAPHRPVSASSNDLSRLTDVRHEILSATRLTISMGHRRGGSSIHRLLRWLDHWPQEKPARETYNQGDEHDNDYLAVCHGHNSKN
jgi:hypothetical protein